MEKEILNKLKKLKEDVSPRPEWKALTRDLLLKEINPQDQYQQEAVGISGYIQVFNQIFKQSILEPAVVMLLVLGVFLGSSLTINAAFYSLPGDHLYPVKIALEKTHVALIPDQQKQVELRIEFALKRVAEFDKIVSQVDVKPEEKKKKIEAVVQEYKKSVVAVKNQLNKIKEEENVTPIQREYLVRMAVVVSSKTEELAKSFNEAVEELSEEEKLEVEAIVAEAIQTTQETSLSAQQLIDDAQADADAVAEELADETVDNTEAVDNEAGEVTDANAGEEDTDSADASTDETDIVVDDIELADEVE